MLILLNFICFSAICLLFGYSVTRFVLGFKSLHIVLPLSLLIGFLGNNFLLNLISYTVPISSSVWLTLSAMLVSSFIILYANLDNLSDLDNLFSKRKTKVLLASAIFISLLSGIVALKSLALDDFFMGHMPLASTITEGNFPVHDPSVPDLRLSYHYGAELMSANLNLTTDIPIWLAYDTQIFIFTGSLFFLLFALIFELSGLYGASIAGASLFFYGNGVQWLYFFTDGIPAIWSRFILNEQVTAFWKWLTPLAFPKLNTSYIFIMNNHSFAIGMPALFLALFLYLLALREDSNRKSWVLVLFAGLFYGYTALNIETYFSIFFIALTLSLIIVRTRKHASRTLCFMAIGLLLALVQGGILSSIITDNNRDSLIPITSVTDFMTLNLAPNPAQLDNSATFITLFSSEFFIQFGLPIILIFPAVWFFIKRRHGPFLLLALAGFGAYAVPLLFRYPIRPWEMSRFFSLAIPLFAMLCGVWLMYILPTVSKRMKYVVFTGVLLLGASGLLSQTIFAVSNLDRFGSVGPLIAQPPSPSPSDKLAYAWIKANTTQADRFFPYSEEFVRHTGRFTPGAYPYFTFRGHQEEQAQYDKIVNDCDTEAFAYFKINYIYISSNFPIIDYIDCMKKIGAKSVYDNNEVAIYELK